MKGGLALEFAVELDVLVRFLVRTLIVFALIFLLAVVTPRIARLVDNWIARYRKNHDPKKDESYGIRSIYELPPRSGDEDAPAGEQASSAAQTEPVSETEHQADAAGAPPAKDAVPWFKR